MSLIGYALVMARKFYDAKTYNHALRVATYVAENPMIHEENMENCIALAIMHDLWKETDFPKSAMKNELRFRECLELLTKPEDMDYIVYIKNIKEYSDINPEAYWVKMADIKDHLFPTDVLTEKLKEKYLAALSYLL
ncbi:MAG: hypothetical protein HFJ09_02135 [Lachnospiraceae bacterium]|nr:hypothetical protein [Lachnospiraceae bacterium]